jgi:mannose-6-phosphate isomerase-like protein (cupin superfamily)
MLQIKRRNDMIRRSDEIKERRVQNARGGDNEVIFYDWMKPEDAKGHGRLFSKLVIPPGASIGYHEHSGEFEAFYVISGEATIDDNGKQEVIKAGDMAICKDGEGHSTRNNGSEDLVLIAMIMNTL